MGTDSFFKCSTKGKQPLLQECQQSLLTVASQATHSGPTAKTAAYILDKVSCQRKNTCAELKDSKWSSRRGE